MTPETFRLLQDARLTMEQSGAKPAGIFVPHLGSRLRSEGGIFFVGQATRGDWYSETLQNFEQCSKNTRDFLKHPDGLSYEMRLNRNFWKFCDLVLRKTVQKGLLDDLESWGWSNILKIGDAEDGPGDWGENIRRPQRAGCIQALREECSSLTKSMIIIMSGDDFLIVPNATDSFGAHPPQHISTDWTSYTRDDERRLVIVRSYHPRYIAMQGKEALNSAAEDIAANYRRLAGEYGLLQPA